MQFNLNQSLEILDRTPAVLEVLLEGLSSEWTHGNEGPDTWSPYEVIGHLIHGEKTDWVPRMEIILAEKGDKKFEPFDRFAQAEASRNKSLQQLLAEFKALRGQNIACLRSKNITPTDLLKRGIHPAFGEVTLQQLLSTWVVHDLNHLAQIARAMAKQYHTAVGPWQEYLGILK